MAAILTNTGAEVDLLLRKGAGFARTIVYKTNNVVVNITGYTFSAQVRTEDGVLAATFTCQVVNGAQGQFSIALTAVSIASLTIGGQYYWDLEVVANGATHELMRGRVSVIDESTK